MRDASAAPPTVLAVDDDPVVRDCLGIVLGEHCRLLFAADGIEAINTLRVRPVDVVLLDLFMPRMNGEEALALMRRDGTRAPVIVLTAVADVRTVVAAMKNGAWDYVTKPWDDDVLISLVHRAAQEKRDEGGVLLVSDSPSALAPLQLCLESQTRVLSTNIAQALRCQFLPTAIVVECSSTGLAESVPALRDRFPKIPIIVLRQDGRAPVDRRDGPRLGTTVDSSSLDGVFAELLRFRAINHAIVPHAHAIVPHAAANAAVKFMVAHYDEPLTVREIAHAANLSEGRLAHIFRETTGYSVKDYMIRLRVSIARRLLNETSDTLNVIATRTGYADVSHFSRTFKSIDGVSPGEFRRSRSGG